MNEHSSSLPEGSPAVEQAERQILGNENYQKVEVVHRFANAHPWFHPLLWVGVLVITFYSALLLRNFFKKE